MSDTLIIALSSYAGMGPYVATIVNSFEASDPVWFVLGEDERRYYTKNIKQELRSKCMIVCRADSAWNKLRSLFFADNRLGREIEEFMQGKDIQNIHLLTGEMALRGMVKRWDREYNVCQTIHDLHPHEAAKAPHKMWRQRRCYKFLDEMRAYIPRLITNSRAQYEELRQMYPQKEVFFHDFPTLVTDEIKDGTTETPEIEGKNGYVLFFGRIEQYKGLHLLYDAWLDSPALHDRYTLVIAGSGDIYFSRRQDERNIVLINRYIKDEEIASLYRNAACTVYPYISASQSGVLSLSCYFQTPIVASDVPFFRHISEDGIGATFTCGNSQELSKRLLEVLESDSAPTKQRQAEYNAEHYDTKAIHDKLMEIYQIRPVTEKK